MENRVDHMFPKLNYFARTSRWLGVGSVLPYLLLGGLYYLYNKTDIPSKFVEATPVIVILCLLSGFVLGTISLVTGSLALRQISNSQNREIGNHSAAFGIVLGMLSLVINILFCYLFFLALSWAWAE